MAKKNISDFPLFDDDLCFDENADDSGDFLIFFTFSTIIWTISLLFKVRNVGIYS